MVAGIAFLLCAFAFAIHSIVLLLIARFIGGVSSGDQAIAQAAVVDLSSPEKKAIYLGMVLLSVTLGLVIGPLLGAFLENPHYVHWFNVRTPFYSAAILTAVNILLLWWFFTETHPGTKHRIEWIRVFHVFFEAFKYQQVRYLLSAYLLGQLG